MIQSRGCEIVSENFVLANGLGCFQMVGSGTVRSFYIEFQTHCWVFGDALLATQPKVRSRDLLYRPVEHVDLEQPLQEKRGLAICFSAQFYQTPHLTARSTDHKTFPGRKAALPGSCLR